jgi:hypothetical protein
MLTRDATFEMVIGREGSLAPPPSRDGLSFRCVEPILNGGALRVRGAGADTEANPETSPSLRIGNPGGLTLCVLRCLPRATPPGATGNGARIPGTDNEGRCPHPPPPLPLALPFPLMPFPSADPLNVHGEAEGEFVESGKSKGRGRVAPGAGPGEPLEMEVERGRPRGTDAVLLALTRDEVMEGVGRDVTTSARSPAPPWLDKGSCMMICSRSGG